MRAAVSESSFSEVGNANPHLHLRTAASAGSSHPQPTESQCHTSNPGISHHLVEEALMRRRGLYAGGSCAPILHTQANRITRRMIRQAVKQGRSDALQVEVWGDIRAAAMMYVGWEPLYEKREQGVVKHTLIYRGGYV